MYTFKEFIDISDGINVMVLQKLRFLVLFGIIYIYIYITIFYMFLCAFLNVFLLTFIFIIMHCLYYIVRIKILLLYHTKMTH